MVLLRMLYLCTLAADYNAKKIVKHLLNTSNISYLCKIFTVVELLSKRFTVRGQRQYDWMLFIST